MEKAFSTSPFDGRSGAEIREKWILWQKHAANEEAQRQKDTDRRSVPTESRTQEPPQAPVRPVFQHSRYDAVMKRMQHAARQTGTYTTVS